MYVHMLACCLVQKIYKKICLYIRKNKLQQIEEMHTNRKRVENKNYLALKYKYVCMYVHIFAIAMLIYVCIYETFLYLLFI